MYSFKTFSNSKIINSLKIASWGAGVTYCTLSFLFYSLIHDNGHSFRRWLNLHFISPGQWLSAFQYSNIPACLATHASWSGYIRLENCQSQKKMPTFNCCYFPPYSRMHVKSCNSRNSEMKLDLILTAVAVWSWDSRFSSLRSGIRNKCLNFWHLKSQSSSVFGGKNSTSSPSQNN